MDNELMRYATGEVTPRWGDRNVARRAKGIYNEVQEKDMMARGAAALGADIMDLTVELYNHGKRNAGDDPMLGRVMADEFTHTVRNMQDIQDSLYEGRGYGGHGPGGF